jgi:hypothetical protein
MSIRQNPTTNLPEDFIRLSNPPTPEEFQEQVERADAAKAGAAELVRQQQS